MTYKRIIFISLLLATTISVAGPFDKYVSNSAPEPDSGTTNTTTISSDSGIGDKINDAIGKAIVSSTENPDFTRADLNSGLTLKELEQINKQEFLKDEIKKAESTLAILRSKAQFVKKIKKINLKKKDNYVDIYIPFNNQTTIEFDQEIKEISYLSQDNITIQQKQKNNKILEILNKNPDLLINVKLTFIDDTEFTIVIQTGKTEMKRYVDYKIFTDYTSLASKTLFMKPTKVRTIHNDFNNKALYLILSRITKNPFYKKLRENIHAVNKVLYSGESKIEGLYGLSPISYTMELNNVYESPFIKTSRAADAKKTRLILMELTITNDMLDKTLTINEMIIKNRFDNLVAAYLGNIQQEENIISPKQNLRILIVIEDEVLPEGK